MQVLVCEVDTVVCRHVAEEEEGTGVRQICGREKESSLDLRIEGADGVRFRANEVAQSVG